MSYVDTCGLDEKRALNCLQVALDVHATVNGSYARADGERAADVSFLRKKLEHWHDGGPGAFDDACRAVIEAALREADGEALPPSELMDLIVQARQITGLWRFGTL